MGKSFWLTAIRKPFRKNDSKISYESTKLTRSVLADIFTVISPTMLRVLSVNIRRTNDYRNTECVENMVYANYVSHLRVYQLTLRRLMSYIYIYIYIYGAPILDVSRSHTTTQHSR